MNLKYILPFCIALMGMVSTHAQVDWQGKFEQLGTGLATPNEFHTASGAPGENYWQQRADYTIKVRLDDKNQILSGSETITYTNNSPDELSYLWVQLDQNVRAKGNLNDVTKQNTMKSTISSKSMAVDFDGFDYGGGVKVKSVTDGQGKPLPFTINRTMMRVDMPQPLKSGGQYTFSITWSYRVYDRMEYNGRGGYEYFPEEDNYTYTIAQWYPRMAVYDDVNGWQNKQFIGNGEFALTFGDFKVEITVPTDHIVAATGELQNPEKTLSHEELRRFEQAKTSFNNPVFIVTEEEVRSKEKTKATEEKTWVFHAKNVRDFAFASSRKFIWDAQAVRTGNTTPLAMSFYPKEGNPLWERESTKAIKNTLEVYSERTFDYPYPVAISVHTASIGMEYPMICFNWGRPNADGTYSQRRLENTVGVIIHEIGHNFFPMIVNSDERQWTWMDEGLNSFLERETKRERYPDHSILWGSPYGMVPYMKLEKRYVTPIMTNSEQVKQLGNNAYGKPSAALTILRETVMGPELFDKAFKEYAERWAFKHPKPADFFRTMEDASAVDLDWFWKGWFYSTDHVDIAIDDVKWYRLRSGQGKPEEPGVKVTEGQDTSGKESLEGGYQEFSLSDSPFNLYGEFKNRVDETTLKKELADKNFYEVKFTNKGGLVMPLLVGFIFEDNTRKIEHIPAEIWRKNEHSVSKVFIFDKKVKNIVLDPEMKTADTDMDNNVFPKEKTVSKFDKFKAKGGKPPKKLSGKWNTTVEIGDGEKWTGHIILKGRKNKLKGTMYSDASKKTYNLQNIKLNGNDLTTYFTLTEGDMKVYLELFVVQNQFWGLMKLSEFEEYEIEGRKE